MSFRDNDDRNYSKGMIDNNNNKQIDKIQKVIDGFSKQNILDCKIKEKMKKVVDQQQKNLIEQQQQKNQIEKQQQKNLIEQQQQRNLIQHQQQINIIEQQQQKKLVEQQKKNLNSNSRSFFNLNDYDQIWENKTQSNYKNNVYYQDYLNTSRNVSSNDNLLNSINKTHLKDNNHNINTKLFDNNQHQAFYTNNTESSEKSNSNTNIHFLHNSFSYQFSNSPHLIYEQKQDTRYQIFLDKVLDDTRTTLMIKNIPNKYKMQCLINEINSLGHTDKYNFFYVPVDFNNNCNRGYAFINFIHQKYIYQFYLDFNNRKWSMYNSDKICQIKYGSIQGFDYLVKHFHTASIMKDERYKPYIRYYIQHDENTETEIFQSHHQSFLQ